MATRLQLFECATIWRTEGTQAWVWSSGTSVPAAPRQTDTAPLPDAAVVAEVVRGATDRFGILVQRYNQRLYRVARGVLGHDEESEDVLQEAWLRALAGLPTFRGESSLATWLTTIVLREARARLRRRPQVVHGEAVATSPDPSPLESASASELQRLLEARIDALPTSLRLVFVLRELEQMSVAETASALGVSRTLVKVRAFRARKHLQMLIRHCPGLAEIAGEAYGFAGLRCQRMWAWVRRHLERSVEH